VTEGVETDSVAVLGNGATKAVVKEAVNGVPSSATPEMENVFWTGATMFAAQTFAVSVP
jgi:hypothetical protein